MARKPDAMALYDEVLYGAIMTDPWMHAPGDRPSYAPDYGVLEDLLSQSVRAEVVSESGTFPKALDLWVSYELRRAGFFDYEVWPRLAQPRVLTYEIAKLLEGIPRRVRDGSGKYIRDFDFAAEVERRVFDEASVTPAAASVLGRAYYKQVDVVISKWDRGPELLVSTKAQVSSFTKNTKNRFEEAVGDAMNLTSRYPMAAVGFFLAQRGTVKKSEFSAVEKTVDMMIKLRSDTPGLGYTSTGLCHVDWDDDAPRSERSVTVSFDDVPAELQPDRFFIELIERVLQHSPITDHVAVRERISRKSLAVQEGEDKELAAADDIDPSM